MNIALFVYDVYRPLLLNFLISQQKIYKCCQKAFDPAMKRHLYRTSHIYIYTFLYVIFAIFFFFVNIILYRGSYTTHHPGKFGYIQICRCNTHTLEIYLSGIVLKAIAMQSSTNRRAPVKALR